MNNFAYQLKINLKRFLLRNPFFFIFTISLPAIFYLIYTKVAITDAPAGWNKRFLVSMIVYGILINSLSTLSRILSSDDKKGFKLFVKLSPTSLSSYYANIFLIFEFMNLIAVSAVALVGVFINKVNLTFENWLILLVAVPILCLPFALIGVLISFVGDENAVGALANLLMFTIAILSGLWWPLNMMPDYLQKIGKIMPGYPASQLSLDLLLKQNMSGNQLQTLFIWLIVLILILGLVVKNKGRKA
ncbi:ABC transporter permease [Lactobacillus mulieris]|uniref:ABC transporter permease n=1 Tax=Lactobacillus mulieris TaxID=2508708 RepID=A0AAW5WZJ5_9LACO|nr:ABC transporter permease [Lactobacillus mulieris]MCZ3622653.1 ABC transporter permease [Lactobacillus mulieris]MCZ3624291.1 ABC transporter permease [Lactobacillus mulieris]MCZ3636660.1 ABC transporter permease [Lactobacillus mulieris]MCZ3690392.1 ABC transporter permease [Lactobacillus mulieris]MCZ3696352.1 ABC transporter permease [Lactobacillus mulieris]